MLVSIDNQRDELGPPDSRITRSPPGGVQFLDQLVEVLKQFDECDTSAAVLDDSSRSRPDA